MTEPRVLSYGDRALLVELTDAAAVVAAADALATDPACADLAALLDDVVPGARTLLLLARPGVSLDRLRSALAPGIPVADRPDSRPERRVRGDVVIEVEYDGPDLAEVAELTGLTPDEVVAAHTGTLWRVAFGGFAPGFGYLVGGDPRLQVPRRGTPRTSVPAGAVGLAGEFSGIYPRSSPGGWQLIGRTDAVLWDLEREPPALLAPGATVRFVVAGESR